MSPGAAGVQPGTVSVVIPSYNRAHCLKRTVDSVLTQTYPPIEVLVVDDGSTDATPEVCRGFASPVRCIRQQNGGVAVARNRGIAEARGELVALLDADDLWAPRKLEMQAAVFAAFPEVGIVTCDHRATTTDGAPLEGRQGFARDFGLFVGPAAELPAAFFDHHLTAHVIDAAGGFRAWVGDFFPPLFLGNFILPSAAIFRRRLVDQVGPFRADLRLAEETEFFHRLASVTQGAIIDVPLVDWTRGRGETLVSPANTERLIRNALDSVDGSLALRARTPAIEALHRRGRNRLLLDLAWCHLSNYRSADARAVLADVAPLDEDRGRLRTLRVLAGLPVPALRALHWAKRTLLRS